MSESTVSHWLLVMGSNVDAHLQLDRALVSLADIGEVGATSERLTGDDVSGGALVYVNQLVELRASSDTAELTRRLKSIERQQGRSAARLADGMCDLDIDLLARLDQRDQPEWLADKPRQIPAVQRLLKTRFGRA